MKQTFKKALAGTLGVFAGLTIIGAIGNLLNPNNEKQKENSKEEDQEGEV